MDQEFPADIPIGETVDYELDGGRVQVFHAGRGVIRIRTFGSVGGRLVDRVFPIVDDVLERDDVDREPLLFLDHTRLRGFDYANLRSSIRWYYKPRARPFRAHFLAAEQTLLSRIGLKIGFLFMDDRHVVHDSVAGFDAAVAEACADSPAASC